MFEFTERHHAFISASFFKKLRDTHGETGLSVFTHATQRYAGQRGSRMAQRAMMLGLPLTFETYCALGEWDYSESFINSIASDHIQVLSTCPDYCYNVIKCPWNEQYKDMGLLDGAVLYCQYLDLSIAYGFNPDLDFRVLQTMHNTGKCVFELKNACLTKEPQKLQDWTLPFIYHCSHIYYTFSAIVKSVFKLEGAALSLSVLEDFACEYGKNAADKILEYKHVDFNVLYRTTQL